MRFAHNDLIDFDLSSKEDNYVAYNKFTATFWLSDSRVDQRPSKGSMEYGGFNYESSAANHSYQFPAPHSIDQSNAANSTTDFKFQSAHLKNTKNFPLILFKKQSISWH